MLRDGVWNVSIEQIIRRIPAIQNAIPLMSMVHEMTIGRIITRKKEVSCKNNHEEETSPPRDRFLLQRNHNHSRLIRISVTT